MPTRAGKTPLMLAAEYKKAEMMSYLLDMNEDLRAETTHGWTVRWVVLGKWCRELRD